MNKVMNLTYASSLTSLRELNSSFDTGVLRIAYAGENKNGSYIGKETFERCKKSIYNCPIVCNYDRESDTLGGHDVEVAREEDGSMRLVNLTVPVGVIPESARVFYETVTEEDGTEHEYLCADALIWKRQEAYRKIKRDGCAAQSMEITVRDGEMVDGVYHINDFEFTAFALISVPPCFESASLSFASSEWKRRLEEMMADLRQSFSLVDSSREDEIEISKKGGDETLEENEKKAGETETDLSEKPDDEVLCVTVTATPESFALDGNLRAELERALDDVTLPAEWGAVPRYLFVDYDRDAGRVYCYDGRDGLLYGFAFTLDGDAVTIDFESKERMKIEIVPFEGGSETAGEETAPAAGENSPPARRDDDLFDPDLDDRNPDFFARVYGRLTSDAQRIQEMEVNGAIADVRAEKSAERIAELEAFKAEVEGERAAAEREAVFARFDDLKGEAEFESLRENCADLAPAEIEEKCFAMRGRNATVKFSEGESKAPKLMIEKSEPEKLPYGGLFEKYGVTLD